MCSFSSSFHTGRTGRIPRNVIFYLFVQLAFVNVDFLGGLLEALLQQNDILLVLFALKHDFLDGALLFPQNLDGLGVSAFLLVQLDFHIANASLELGDDASATNDGVGLNFLKTNGKVLGKKEYEINICLRI